MKQDQPYTIAVNQTIRVGDYVENYNTEAHTPKKYLMQIARLDANGETFGSKADQQYMVHAERQLKYCKRITLGKDKPEKDSIVEMLKHYYETDLDNCTMSHEQWIDKVADALTNPDFLKDFKKEYEEYKQELNA
jgi:hypothetical protein